MMKKWILILLFISLPIYADPIMTKVIQLNYLQADNVIQLIQPLLSSNEKVTGSGQTLIVQVSPKTLTKIREVLHLLDAPPVTFDVSVYQGDPNWLSSQNQNSVTYSTQPRSDQQRSQSVKVMSGESAYIATGQEVPIVTAVGVGWQTGISYQQRNIKNGLLVAPVLRGSQVELTLTKVREQMSPSSSQEINNQQLHTTLMIPLNKWVSLGSAEGATKPQSNSVVYTAGQPFTRSSTLYIKVSVVNAISR